MAGLLIQRYLVRWIAPLFASVADCQIRAWIAKQVEPVHVYMSPVDWLYPYRQRPHHIVNELVRRGLPTIFVTPATGYDRTVCAAEVGAAFLTTPHCRKAIKACRRPIVHMLSTDTRCDDLVIALVERQGGIIVYDYIDAMEDAVISAKFTEKHLVQHERLLKDEDIVVVVASSEILFQQVSHLRKSGFALITNGVELKQYSTATRNLAVRRDFVHLISLGRPIIGYFGAFASWFDYDLVNKLARERPNYTIVLFGPDLDGTRDRFDRSLANLHVLRAMDYEDIPRHAVWFDVCLVPFIINQITLATSPLKIFEYMALGKPTVSTDLPECRKYLSVLIGSSPEAFLLSVDHALSLGADSNYIALARKEAEDNSWPRKVDDILSLINTRRR